MEIVQIVSYEMRPYVFLIERELMILNKMEVIKYSALLKLVNEGLFSILLTSLFTLGLSYSLLFEKGIYFFSIYFISYLLTFYFLANIYAVFKIGTSRISELIYSAILSVFLTNVTFYMIAYFLHGSFPDFFVWIGILFLQCLLIILWARIVHNLYFRIHPPQRTLVISHDDSKAMVIYSLISLYKIEKRYEIVKEISYSQVISSRKKYLTNIDAVFLTDLNRKQRNIIIKDCVASGVDIYFKPSIEDLVNQSSEPLHLFHSPILFIENKSILSPYQLIKRVMDICISLVVLIVLSPILIITALAIKLYDGGSVFYRQERLTKGGKVFKILKFRSMRMDAEKDGIARLSSGKKDCRVTSIGKIIRATRIDELPQLFNILKGDMTIVGPRPERPEIANEYEKELPEFALRLQVKAGLTGYAQVFGKYNTPVHDKLLFDLMYISKSSLVQDMLILLATIKVVFIPESTDGVADGQVTANIK